MKWAELPPELRKDRIGQAVRRRRDLRIEQRDYSVPMCCGEKTTRIDLGLALLSRIAVPGVCYTRSEIAVWAGCTDSMIYQIELRALKKLRNRLRFIRDPRLVEMIAGLFDEQRPAERTERIAA